jgi:hypothetical protein
VPDAAMTAAAREVMVEQLKSVGFSDVTMLTQPPGGEPGDIDVGTRTVAA